MPPQIRLAIFHGNPLFRECLTWALRAYKEYDVAMTNDGWQGELASAAGERPDVVLVDAGLSNSAAFAMVQKLGASNDRPRTILMISTATPDLIESCLKAGADGCVLDDDTLMDLCQAIESVGSGRSYCSPNLASRLFARSTAAAPPTRASVDPREYRLTRREIEILRLIAERDLSNKQIARELRLSIYTVKNHIHSIIEKLAVEDRQSAVRHAVRQGILADPVS